MSKAGSSKGWRRPTYHRIGRAILYRLRRIGIRIEPFVVVREGEAATGIHDAPKDFGFGFLSVTDVDELVQLDPSQGRDMVRDWLAEGKLCFGVRDGAALVARMWCDLDEFNYPPNYRKLDDDEAYLFAAFANPDYRGKNLAPLMRTACYEALRSMGRRKFYSYTDYFNTSARRFKIKLHARNESLRVFFDLFGKWSKTLTVRTYD